MVAEDKEAEEKKTETCFRCYNFTNAESNYYSVDIFSVVASNLLFVITSRNSIDQNDIQTTHNRRLLITLIL